MLAHLHNKVQNEQMGTTIEEIWGSMESMVT
jgi:hypothetical protein